MYRSFFGLRERAFDLTPNPRFLVLTDGHREALSNLDYGIASRKGITLLLGEAGTGKTTVIRAALERQPDRIHRVHLHNPALTRDEFVEMLAARFGLSPEAKTSKSSLLLELESLMRDRHGREESTVLIVDEAQAAPTEILEELRLLANIETDETKLLSVVLAGQPELSARLNQDSLRQLKQRIALRCELRPLTLIETLGYVAGRIAAAGGIGAKVFTREAVMLLHERSGGIPRTISVLADNALLAGFAVGIRPVGRAIVEEVCADLDMGVSSIDDARDGSAAPSADDRARHTSGPPRVLALDSPVADGPLSRESTTAAPTGASGRGESGTTEAGMFISLYPKRRRFSIF
ncbi:MAG: ExeA family protein [Acidobacteriota bacterium]